MLSNRLPFTRSQMNTLQSTSNIPVCPALAKLKKHQDWVAQHMALGTAFSELLKFRASNGGKNRYGDIKQIIDCFQENGFTISRSQLEYRLLLRKQGISIALNTVPPIINIEDVNNNETVSNLTTDTNTYTNDNLLLTNNKPAPDLIDDLTIDNNNSESSTRKGGRTIGLTNK